MTRKMILSAATLVLGAGLAFCQHPGGAAPAAGPAQKAVRFLGKVESVDAGANAVTIKNHKGESRTFTIPAGVPIMAGKAAVAVGQLKLGSEVVVTLDASDAVKSAAVLTHRHHRHERNGAEAPAKS